MTDALRLAIAQLNPTVGDLAGAAALVRQARGRGAAEGVNLVVTPELSLTGYPPEDLVLKPALIADAMASARALAEETGDGGPALIVGCPWREEGEDGLAYNAVLLLDGGAVRAVRFKRELPNYGVFDEKRVFRSGPIPEVVRWRGVTLGLPICEDIWLPQVPRALIDQGAEIMICINGSPWRRGIRGQRAAAFRAWRGSTAPPLVFVNQVGGQDELVFDGASFVWDETGREVVRLKAFAPDFAAVTLARSATGWRCAPSALVSGETADDGDGEAADYRAATLALGDYVNKNGFPGVVLGLSGGIDSALTAAMAVDGLGVDRVWCVMLPSRHTSQASLEDAEACARALGVRYDTIDIEPVIAGFDQALGAMLAGRPAGVTEENLQSRARGVILMALSNAFGPMVVTTGNKSEMAVGYATLYGDMNGGYNPLKDFYKTEVFALARWRNAWRGTDLLGPAGPVIPERILTKPPSAELRPNQTDQDSLPPYDVLDDILMGLVEREEAIEIVIARGHDAATVERVQRMLYLAEYKRRQAAPGPKIGARNFGRDRRYPITNRYRDRAD